jgi:hypothetical protein
MVGNNPVGRGAFRNYLWEKLPQSRPIIEKIEADEIADAEEYEREPFLGLYDYVSQVYWWGVFEPALQQGDRVLAARCLEVAETALIGSDDLLKEALGIRVLPHLLSWPTYTADAGPCVRRELRTMSQG